MTEENWKYKIGERIIAENSGGPIDITITNREIRRTVTQSGKYKGDSNTVKFYEYKCNICGAEHLWQVSHRIGKIRCSCCAGFIRIKGINTLGDLYPELIPYFDGEDAFDTRLKFGGRCDVKCPECGYVKNMLVDNLIRKRFYCDRCNSIANKRPDLVKYLVYEEDATLSYGSTKKVLLKCPDCDTERYMDVEHLVHDGFRCSICGDGISFPEKFMICVLTQLNVDFVRQLSSKDFEWCNGYKYDFYVNGENMIIETHGQQHYEEKFTFSRCGGKTLTEEHENDKNKEYLAKINGIDKYIILDCRKSTLDWVKQSILNSQLNKIYDLSNIDWDKCAAFAYKGIVKEICNYWNHGDTSVKDLMSIFQLGGNAVRRYLKQGTELGWCNYDSELEFKRKNTRPVMVFKDEKCIGSFKSLTELERKSIEMCGVYISAVIASKVCRGLRDEYKGLKFKFANTQLTKENFNNGNE